MLSKYFKYLISLSISIYLFTIISKEIYVNFNFFEILINKYFTILLVFIIFLPIFYLLSLKLIFLVNHIQVINFFNSFKATMIAYNYNLFFPAKAGDFFRYKYLDLSISIKNFINLNILEKLISLFVLIILILIGYILSDIKNNQIIILNNFYFIGIVIFQLFIFFLIFKITYKKDFLFKKIFKLFSYDLLIWLLQFLQIYLIVYIFNININFFDVILIFGTSIFIGLLPVSVGGFGVRDYIVFYFFEKLGLVNEVFSVLILFNFRYLFPVLISFLITLYNIKNVENN